MQCARRRDEPRAAPVRATQGNPHRFTHARTDPPIQFSYDAGTCAATSTSDPRLTGGNLADVYIRFGPYGIWDFTVRGHAALDLTKVTAVRLEFNLHRKPGSFGGAGRGRRAAAPFHPTSCSQDAGHPYECPQLTVVV